jgi:hypothetical protein
LTGNGFGGQRGEQPAVGSFTALLGQVFAIHERVAGRIAINLNDPVLFHDVIQTLAQSQARAWLRDDSLLTVAENSQVRIEEHLVDPSRDIRQVVVSLAQGRVRAFVGKVFAGAGSKFEVHTPTAVAAARGTDFVVWVEHPDEALSSDGLDAGRGPSRFDIDRVSRWSPTTGLANIGAHGDVMFRAGGRVVLVKPGQFSVALPGQTPSSPVPIDAAMPMAVGRAIAGITDSVLVRPSATGPKLKAGPGSQGTIRPNLAMVNSGGIVPMPAIGVPPVFQSGPIGLSSSAFQRVDPRVADIKLLPAGYSTVSTIPSFSARR